MISYYPRANSPTYSSFELIQSKLAFPLANTRMQICSIWSMQYLCSLFYFLRADPSLTSLFRVDACFSNQSAHHNQQQSQDEGMIIQRNKPTFAEKGRNQGISIAHDAQLAWQTVERCSHTMTSTFLL